MNNTNSLIYEFNKLNTECNLDTRPQVEDLTKQLSYLNVNNPSIPRTQAMYNLPYYGEQVPMPSQVPAAQP